MIEVMMVGSPVYLTNHPDSLKGTITGITIRNKNYIKYEVSYWVDSVYHIDWFEQNEVQRTKDTASQKIGFI